MKLKKLRKLDRLKLNSREDCRRIVHEYSKSSTLALLKSSKPSDEDREGEGCVLLRSGAKITYIETDGRERDIMHYKGTE